VKTFGFLVHEMKATYQTDSWLLALDILIQLLMQHFDVLHQVSDCLFQLSLSDQEISVLFKQFVIPGIGRLWIFPSFGLCRRS
jgi:hypothetical protein